MSFTISTMGITQKPRPIAIAYSPSSTLIKPKAPARSGTSHTTVVSSNEPTAAPMSMIVWPGSLKMLPRCERMLNEWNIYAMDIVRNAIVMPSGLSAISHTPLSMKWPMKYDVSVSAETKSP